MLATILKVAFIVFILAMILGWVLALISWDGECHYDCNRCPYSGGCEHEKDRR